MITRSVPRLVFALGWSCLVLSPMTGPAAATDLPEGGEDRVAGDWIEVFRFGRSGDDDAAAEVVDVPDMPFAKAVRVTTTRRPENPWSVTLHAPTRGDIGRGDILLLSFWMRARPSAGAESVAVANVMWEDTPAPNRNLTGYKFQADEDWLFCVTRAESPRSRSDGDHQVAIHLGYDPQTVEIGGLRAINYHQNLALDDLPYMHRTYDGREPDAAWRKDAEDRIRRHRMGDLRIRVVDEAGKTVPDAPLSVSMRGHAFGFGSVVHPRFFAAEDADGARYRETFFGAFNKASLETGFRWQNWTRGGEERIAEGRRELAQTMDALVQADVEVRGHYLMWAPVDARNKPPHLMDQPEALREALWAHAEEKARWAGDRIGEWDAVNHIVGWGTRMADLCGGNQVYADMIRDGRNWAPHAEMWINEGQVLVGDGGRLAEYQAMVQDLVDREAAPDGVGFMGHFKDQHLPSPEEVYRRLEAFAPFGASLQLTELDVDCGPDDRLQADYLRDVVTIAFSHPSVEAVVLWGFWEGRHWMPDAALWRRDWTIKPAGEAWLELIQEQWRTRDMGSTAADGTYTVRGFIGEYEIAVWLESQSNRRVVWLPRDGLDVELVVARP